MSGKSRRGADHASRLAQAAAFTGTSGKVCPADRATLLLEAIIEPGDRVTIEGDNQKQADFLASALAKVDPARVHDLHMVQSVLALPDHLAVFERGIANRLDFAFAGPQSRKLAELVANGTVKIGAIHTYLELYARMLVDLTPRVALIVADKADRNGNLYTGPNTEDTPTIAEAAAFRAGIVDSVYCFGSELGMERYVSNRAGIFPVGADGNLRSNRALAQVAGQYACDLFIGGTLQIDAQGNSSTATKGRITGFGGAPNMGADPRGRRHDSPTWLRAGQEAGDSLRGRKLVVQMVQTRQPNGAPSFVEQLDAFDLAASAGFALPPVMIYGDDITHVITERGVANLLRCRSPQEREAALRAVAGDTEFGRRQPSETSESLRRRGIVMFPSDLGIDVNTAR